MNIKYGELCGFGAVYAKTGNGNLVDELENESHLPPLWLFRNGIKDYDRIGRPLNKWLVRLMRWTISGKRRIGKELKSGFREYDDLMIGNCELIFEGDITAEFFGLCDLLIEEIEAAERKKPDMDR